MIEKRISLRQAVKFHGHLGPYLALGLLAGELGVKKLAAKKYFGINVKVFGATRKPKSCLIDGLQLSSGATYGKGNISRLNGSVIKIAMADKVTGRKVTMALKKSLLRKLQSTTGHRDCESLAKQIYKTDCSKLFNLK